MSVNILFPEKLGRYQLYKHYCGQDNQSKANSVSQLSTLYIHQLLRRTLLKNIYHTFQEGYELEQLVLC